jgi:hypothetical protein
MYFTCTGCSEQFTHTKRTVAAWEKGSRRVFCDACHKKWRNARPPRTAPPRSEIVSPRATAGIRTVPSHPAKPHYSADSNAPGGCLGVVLLLLLIPAVIFAVVINA